MARELEEHLVPHDPPARHVAPSGFRFAPGSQFTKHRGPFCLERVPATNTLVAFLGFPALFSHRRFQPRKFLADPFQSAQRMQAILQMRMDREEEFNIFQCVRDLVIRERARTPVGKGMGFG